MTETTLNDGQRAFVKMQSLAPYPGSLLVIHPRDAVLAAWRSDVAQIVTLFVVTLGVLMLLGRAFHWQAAKAAEADRTLPVATQAARDGADARPLRPVGLGPRARAHVLVALDVRDLGLEPRDALLGFGEVSRLIHPDDRRPDGARRVALRGGEATVDRCSACATPTDAGSGSGRAPSSSTAPGERPHLIGIAVDVTEQKLVERLKDRRYPPPRRHRDDLGSLRAVGRRQPPGHVQLEIPAVPRAAGRASASRGTPYDE